MMDKKGTTSQQMRDAPRGAHYVWISKALAYPRALAKHLGREDLIIVSPNFFAYKARGHGLRVKIIIDHGCVLPVTQAATIRTCNTLVS